MLNHVLSFFEIVLYVFSQQFSPDKFSLLSQTEEKALQAIFLK